MNRPYIEAQHTNRDSQLPAFDSQGNPKTYNSILGMQQEGVYIMSYWNNNNALTFEGLHGIAVQVYADGTVQTYNKGEMGPDETISFSDFISEHENGYIIGYYLGNPSENGEN